MTKNLRHILILAALAAMTAMAAGLPSPSRAATEGRLRVELLVDGVPVREYRSQGTTYVEARRGREYAVRLTNLEPVRVAVALAVDGRNTIDGKRTSARDARKWILAPWQSVTVRGWQVDGNRARRFYFTSEDRSYAEWLGDTRNVGIIEAVAFRERQWRHDDDVWSSGREKNGDRNHPHDERADAPGWGREKSGRQEMPAPAPGAQSEAKSRSSASSQGTAQGSARAEERSSDSAEENAATGIGRDVRHDVVRVEFDQEDWASATVRVRYEFRERLMEMGIMPRYRDDYRDRWYQREQSSGFEDDSYAPEPPRHR